MYFYASSFNSDAISKGRSYLSPSLISVLIGRTPCSQQQAQHNSAWWKAGKGTGFLSGCYQFTLLAPAAAAAYPRAALAHWFSVVLTGSANKHGTDETPRWQLERTSEEDQNNPDSHQGNQFRKTVEKTERLRKVYVCQITNSCNTSSFIRGSNTFCIFIQPFLSLQANDNPQCTAQICQK